MCGMSEHNKTRRLFFALWPSGKTRQAIVDTYSSLSLPAKGRTPPWQNLHITLHFIGQVSEEIKDCMHAAAQQLEIKSFILNFDRLGYFSRAKILWMGCQQVPAELTQLHTSLGVTLTTCGYQLEKRVYAPHITLKRKCPRTELKQAEFSIPWQVNQFVLVESVPEEHGVSYHVIETYPLT